MARLQVALDLLDLERCLRIADAALRAGAHVVEVGTPLVKYCGMEAVREFRRRFPNSNILADMKTVDAGTLEARMAFEAGANAVTVMGFASNETIECVVEVARELGGCVMVDLMSVAEPSKRIRELVRFEPDIFCLHVGKDVQIKRGVDARVLAEEVRKLKRELGVGVAVAGGIDESTAGLFAEAGADVIIVGGAITKSGDPASKTRAILEAMGGVG